MDQLYTNIEERFSRLDSDRATLNNYYDHISRFVLPRQSKFYQEHREEGYTDLIRIRNSKPVQALSNFASIYANIITPRGMKWHKLKLKKTFGQDSKGVNLRNLLPNLSQDLITGVNAQSEARSTRVFLEKFNNDLLEMRNATFCNFYDQNHEVCTSVGAFGNGVLFIDKNEDGIYYKNYHISNIYIDTDYMGRVDSVYRKFQLTVRQAMQQFGDDISPETKAHWMTKDPGDTMKFLHVVAPIGELDNREMDGHKYSFYYASCDDQLVLRKGFYRTMPYAIDRYFIPTDEKYGQSPTSLALCDIKNLNIMTHLALSSAWRAVTPPLLAPSADDSNPFKFRIGPDAIIQGGLTPDGERLVRPMEFNARPDLGLAYIKELEMNVSRSFLADLSSVLAENPEMTATAVMSLNLHEHKKLMAIISRTQSEYLRTLLTREISLLIDMGMFDEGGIEIPAEIQERMTDDPHSLLDVLDITFESDITNSIYNDEAISLSRTLEILLPLIQADPQKVMLFNLEEIIPDIAKKQGLPTKYIRSIEEFKQMVQQMQQAQQEQQMAAQAKDLAQANKAVEEGLNLEQQRAV